MAKKRGQNEGNIRKRKDGMWEGRYVIGYDENGKIIRKSVYAKTREDVAIKLAPLLFTKTAPSKVKKVKLVDYLLEWLNTYAKNNIKLSTYTSYETYIRGHIKPFFKNMLITELKADDLQKFINYKMSDGRLDGKKGGISAKTIKNIINMIHASLEQALISELVIKNVSNGVRLPKQIKREMRVLSREEQTKLMNYCNDKRHDIIVILDLFTGMRLGEILALHWSEIDFKKQELLVKYSLKRQTTHDKNAKTKIILDTPKTPNSIRTIPLLDEMIIELTNHRKRQSKEKQLASSNYIDNNFVFCNEHGLPYDQRTFKDSYNSFLHDIKLDKKKCETDENVTFHTLRHTFATRSLEVYMDILVLSKIMGHADVSTTLNKYGHVLPTHKKESINKLKVLYA